MRRPPPPTHSQRDIHRLGGLASRWVIGGGPLWLHTSFFLLSAVGLLLVNLYRTPDQIWVHRPLGVWALLLGAHAGAVALSWALVTANSQRQAAPHSPVRTPAARTARGQQRQPLPIAPSVASRFRPPSSATLAEVRPWKSRILRPRELKRAAMLILGRAKSSDTAEAPDRGGHHQSNGFSSEPLSERLVPERVVAPATNGLASEEPATWTARGDWPRQPESLAQPRAAPVWTPSFTPPERPQNEAPGGVVPRATELTWMEAAATAWLMHRANGATDTAGATQAEPEDRLIPPERPADHPIS